MVQPEDSKLRLSLDDFKAVDAKARAQGRPEGWRLSHEEREARRKAFIAKRPGPELWVLGYGSLMWDPSINLTELRRARLDAWRRRFCLDQRFGRPTAVIGAPKTQSHFGTSRCRWRTRPQHHKRTLAI